MTDTARHVHRYRDAFSSLRFLSHGWLDGKQGRAPSGSGLDWLARQFDAYHPDELPMPWIFPTVEGGVRAEWRTGEAEITLEIDLTEQTGEWHRLDLVSGDEQFENIDLSDTGDWSELTRRLRELGGVSE